MRRFLALLVVGMAPWTAIVGAGGVELVFLYGLANPATGHFVSLPEYLFVLTVGLPDRLLAWPASALLYLGGLAAEGYDQYRADDGRGGDVRITAGLVGLAGAANLSFALGIVTREGATVLPLGPALVGFVVWWFYWPTLRRAGDG
jgi:uncharacterized protein (TIGR04206 family)